MSNRVCFECGRQDSEQYMYQVEVKNKTNDSVKWKWTCYPCQGRKHPVETKRLELEELDRRAAVAMQEQEEKKLKKIAEAWKRLYQKELAVAEDQLSVKLASPFDNFDFSDVKADDKRAYKEFKEAVSQYDKEHVAALFEAVRGFDFDESKPLLTEEFMYEAIEAVEAYQKPGATIGSLLTFTLPAYPSYLMWEEFLWWESLGAGAVSWILLVVIWYALFTKKYPADFNLAISRLKESADAWSEGLTEMHETVLQNTIVELIKSNKTAEERLQARFGSSDKLERMPYDKEESERGALKEKAKELVRKDNFLDLISFVMLYKVAETDGEVTFIEEERISNLLTLSEEDYAFANSFRSYPDSIKVIMKILEAGSIEESFKESLLTNLYAVAAADGHISDSEKKQITEIGTRVGLTQPQLQSLENDAEKFLEGSGNKMRMAAVVHNLDFDDL